jgi:mono/diheme cytochrome c family protein
MADTNKPDGQAPEKLTPEASKPEAEAGRYEDTSLHEVHGQLMREQKEPEELNKPVPMALMWGIFVLFTWAGIYMTTYSGDFRTDIYDPEWRPGLSDEGETVDYASTEWLMERGARLYSNNCAACHQGSGAGLAGVYPPLANSAWVTDGEERLVKILLRGLQGPIVVNGNTYNGAMPSYGENGSGWRDRDIAAVSTYVRQSFGNSAEPILPETVVTIRESIADKSGTWTGEEILSLQHL